MSLLYPADSIPPDDRCPSCEGSGDRWAEVVCCSGFECACGGLPFMEPVDECALCGGTGILDDEARARQVARDRERAASAIAQIRAIAQAAAYLRDRRAATR